MSQALLQTSMERDEGETVGLLDNMPSKVETLREAVFGGRRVSGAGGVVILEDCPRCPAQSPCGGREGTACPSAQGVGAVKWGLQRDPGRAVLLHDLGETAQAGRQPVAPWHGQL